MAQEGHQLTEFFGETCFFRLRGLFALSFCLLASVLALARLLSRLLPVFCAFVPVVASAFFWECVSRLQVSPGVPKLL